MSENFSEIRKPLPGSATCFARKDLLFALAALVGGFALYWQSFGFAWTYDDFPVIVNNPDIQSLGNFLKNHYASRPLRELSFLLDHSLFGLEPRWWHLQQIFWHTLNAILLYALALRLGLSRIAAGLCGLLFLVHPLQVEVVANLSHRKDSLALACLLSGMLCYVRSTSYGWSEAARKVCWMFFSGLFWYLGYLAKETTVLLPMLFIAYELLWVEPDKRGLGYWPWLPISAVAGAGIALVAWLVLGGGAETYVTKMEYLLLLKANYFAEPSLQIYLLMLAKSWVFIVGKVFLPVNLAVEYTYAVPDTLLDPWVVSALVIVAFAAWAVIYCRQRMPLVSFGLTWLVLLFLPTSNIFPLSYFAADRYLYAPICGLILIAGLLLDKSSCRWRVGSLLTMLIICLVLALLTWRQSKVWYSEQALWSNAAVVSPESAFAQYNLGWFYYKELKDYGRAADYYRRAAASNPYFPRAWNGLANISEKLGLYSQARDYYIRTMEVSWSIPEYSGEKGETILDHLKRQYGVEAKSIRLKYPYSRVRAR